MKLLLIVRPVTRHQYTASRIAETFPVAGIVRPHRVRGAASANAWSPAEAAAHARHFASRDAVEARLLSPRGETLRPGAAKVLDVDGSSLAGPETEAFVRGIAPDVLITLGSGLVGPALRQGIRYCLNLHLGMSPRYRGAAGLFWPIYNMDPERIATSIIVLTDKIDGGPIVHHSRPRLAVTDTLHETAVKALMAGVDDLVKVLGVLARGEDLVTRPQKRTGRLYYEADYHPRHLRVTDALMEQGIIGDYLANQPERDAAVTELVTHPGLT